MQQIGLASASYSCGMTMTKADEAKEVQAETTERKLRGATTTKTEDADEAERKLGGAIKVQAKGAVKVVGGGTNGVRTTLGGR